MTERKNTNVNLIKLIAALLVVLCHSYPLTGNGIDFFSNMTKGKFDFGTVGVVIFFSYSGFFLTKSLSREADFVTYIKRRVSRIFPQLLLVVMLTAFVVGPFLTELSIRQYYADAGTYKYLLNAVLLPVHNLPGVFGDSPYNATVNGSLWTLPVEFGCYLLLFAVIWVEEKCGKFDKFCGVFFLILMLVLFPFINTLLANTAFSFLRAACMPVQTFFMGHIWWYFRKYLKFDLIKICCVAIFLTIAVRIREFNLTFVFLLAFQYIIFSFIYSPKQYFPSGEWEQLSYGIYLWGFPIGQIVVQLNSEISPIHHFAITFVISCLLAWIMYRIENLLRGIKNESINNRC